MGKKKSCCNKKSLKVTPVPKTKKIVKEEFPNIEELQTEHEFKYPEFD